MRSLSRTLLAAALIGWVAHLVWVLPGLPDPLATHFDGAGRANGWMSHQGYLLVQVLILGFTAAILLGVTRLVPPHLINVRNRDYWFSPERAHLGMAKLRAWLRGFLAGFVVFFAAGNVLIAQANARQPPMLSSGAFLAVLGGTLLALGLWLFGLMRAFNLPRSTGSGG